MFLHDAFTSTSQTRLTNGILTPTSESGLNVNQSSTLPSKKRKRDVDTMDDLLDDVFVVKPCPSTVLVKPRTLRPVALLPRADLPLASLDTFSTSSNLLPPAQEYEAHVKILELEQRMGTTPMIVLARLDDGKTFYAVERVAKGRYAICKLGSWVDVNGLCSIAILSKSLPQRSALSKADSAVKGVSKSSHVTPESTKYEKKKRLAIEAIQSLVKRPTLNTPSVLRDIAAPQSQPDVSQDIQSQGPDEHTSNQEVPVSHPNAVDILENIRGQYFEALYLSKASLAYFAKGPLSRARAAFHLDYDSTLEMNDLISFLQSFVLTTTVLDKKYKDGLSDIISALDPGSQSGDECEGTKEAKTRKKKKMKPGKSGLYPTEDSYVRRWWRSHDIDTDIEVPGVTLETAMRDRISQLRVRETQLQIIVILEALALQPLATSPTNQDGELPSAGPEDNNTGKNFSSSKVKKSRDLGATLDIHVDRLCIWQSVVIEDGLLSKTPQGKDDTRTARDISGTKRNAADILREFCVEVIVPFFSSRLPEQCKAISRKLGGPIIPSPIRKRSSKSSSSTAKPSRPGAITKRAIPKEPRRSLQRVLTDDRLGRSTSRGPSGAISLMRSATAPVIPGLKREGSETPSLTSIQSADSQSLLVSRAGIQKSKKFSQREVDLNSVGNGFDAKSKKHNIEAELKDAISALKRPNRQLAGQSFVESAEQRTSAVQRSKSKLPSKRSSQHPLFQAVQILATPKPNRRKSMVSEEEFVPEMDEECEPDAPLLPPSSISMILQSSAKQADDLPIQATPSRPFPQIAKSPAIQATPCKVTVPSDLELERRNTIKERQPWGGVPPSPVPSRHNTHQNLNRPVMIHATPVKRTGLLLDKSYRSADSLGPFKTVASLEKRQGISLVENGNTPPAADENIYETLGWDNVDDLL